MELLTLIIWAVCVAVLIIYAVITHIKPKQQEARKLVVLIWYCDNCGSFNKNFVKSGNGDMGTCKECKEPHVFKEV